MHACFGSWNRSSSLPPSSSSWSPTFLLPCARLVSCPYPVGLSSRVACAWPSGGYKGSMVVFQIFSCSLFAVKPSSGVCEGESVRYAAALRVLVRAVLKAGACPCGLLSRSNWAVPLRSESNKRQWKMTALPGMLPYDYCVLIQVKRSSCCLNGSRSGKWRSSRNGSWTYGSGLPFAVWHRFPLPEDPGQFHYWLIAHCAPKSFDRP